MWPSSAARLIELRLNWRRRRRRQRRRRQRWWAEPVAMVTLDLLAPPIFNQLKSHGGWNLHNSSRDRSGFDEDASALCKWGYADERGGAGGGGAPTVTGQPDSIKMSAVVLILFDRVGVSMQMRKVVYRRRQMAALWRINSTINRSARLDC